MKVKRNIAVFATKKSKLIALVLGVLGLFLSLPLFAQNEAQIDKISIYLEASGSNRGFYTTNDHALERSLWDIINCRSLIGNQNPSVEVATIGNRIFTSSPHNDEFESLQWAFDEVKSGGSSDFSECFSTLIDKTDPFSLSIFVTDFWVDGPHEKMESYSAKMTNMFQQHFEGNNSLLVIQGTSDWEGKIYPRIDGQLQSIPEKGKRPYFMFVLGSNANVSAFQQAMVECPSCREESFYNSGIALQIQEPLESPIEKAYAPLEANPDFERQRGFKLYYPNNELIDTLDPEPLSLGLKIKCFKFSRTPQMKLALRTNSNQENIDAILTDTSNWELSDSINFHLDSIGTISPIRYSELVDSNYTHFVYVSIDTTVWKKTKENHEEFLEITFKQQSTSASQTESLPFVSALDNIVNQLKPESGTEEVYADWTEEKIGQYFYGKVYGIDQSLSSIKWAMENAIANDPSISEQNELYGFNIPIKVKNVHYTTSACGGDKPSCCPWLWIILIIIVLLIAWKILQKYSSR